MGHPKISYQMNVSPRYLRNGASPGAVSPLCACGGAGYCPACTHPSPPPLHPTIPPQNHPPATETAPEATQTSQTSQPAQTTQSSQTYLSQTSHTQTIIRPTSPATSLASSHTTSQATQPQATESQRSIEAKGTLLYISFTELFPLKLGNRSSAKAPKAPPT